MNTRHQKIKNKNRNFREGTTTSMKQENTRSTLDCGSDCASNCEPKAATHQMQFKGEKKNEE
jgi:hypothetical protein